jgi:hypothetical protein
MLTVLVGQSLNTRSTCHELDDDGLYTIGAASLRWRPVDGQGRDSRSETHAEFSSEPPGDDAATRSGSPRPTGTGCSCWSARDPNGHNSQVRADGRCFCECHGGR